MNRTTKALARVGTLAVIAGSALSAPFAIGTANAATINFTVQGPTAGTTAGSATTAAIASAHGPDAARQIKVSPNSPVLANLPMIMSLQGSSAYFANPGTGYTLSNNNQVATCTTVANCNTPIFVDDSVPEAATLGASDSGGDLGTATLKFNAINFTVSAQECPTTDIDTVTNCVTQGQVGTAIPVTVHYAAGQSGATDTDGAFRQLVVTVTNPNWTPPQGPVIVGANPATPNTVTCTTDASGNCQLTIVDPNANDKDPAVAPLLGHDTITAAIQPTAAIPYPKIGTIAAGHATAGPQAALNITSGSVSLVRLDLNSAQLIGPTTQDTAAGGSQVNAEPGDAVQLIYTATGGCTPTAAQATCTGQTLAGLSVPLTVDHGYFTPNCETSQSDDPGKLIFNTYGQCSFSTAPAAGGQVGNLTNSGTTKTVVTNTAGQFVVTIGIGRDSAFDAAGAVVANISSTTAASGTTSATTVGSTIPGDRAAGVACTTTGADNVVAPTTTKKTATDKGDCSVGVEWVTNEQPLNGGTAKISIVPALALPNNDSIDTENNYGAPNVTDTGTSNVPDTSRVVFEVDATDQFGNLVSYLKGSAPVKLTKTGPGFVYNCTGSSAVDACVGAVKNGNLTGAAQADGTYTETGSLAGTYNNLPVTAAPTGPQIRYQADVRSQDGSLSNDGYKTGVPGVNDGTQTDVVSWAPPRTTFGTFSGNLWSYNASTATAASDTLTLNFYNQLAQPVVTFTVTPGNKVATSTAVTVTAKLVDQFQNPIVGAPTGTTSGTNGGVGVISVVRSGSNEASCVPAAITGNGGAPATLNTNTSGIAGYTFSCNSPGVSTVSMVVTGPGGTQLASGKEAITFTGSAQHTTVERPTVSLTSFHKHHLTVIVHTSPSLGATRTVNIYRLRNGIKHLVGQTHTGPRGNASLSFSGLRSGATWRVAAKVINLGTQYRSEFSQAVGHRIK